MNQLSLLCTLHADGPATLRRLTAAGCETLEDLERIAVEDLAYDLACNPAVARRLVREARLLRERLDLGSLAPEHEEAVPGFEPRGSGVTAEQQHAQPAGTSATTRRIVEAPPPEPPAEEAGGVPGSPAAPPRLSEEAGGPFGVQPPPEAAEGASDACERELDLVVGGPFAGAPLEASAGEAEPAAAGVPEAPGAPEAPDVPDVTLVPAAPREPDILRPGLIDGLEQGHCVLLLELGVTTPEELVAADGLELAARTGLAYAQVRRLQFLAARV